MSQNSNVIEINGKRYDALSGALLGDKPSSVKSASVPSSGTVVDGFHRAASTIAAATQAATPVASSALPKSPMPSGKLRQFSDMVRTPSSNLPHHQPTSSKTLMRNAVTKPATSLKRSTKVQQRTDVLVKQPSITVAPKLSSYQLDPRRVARAKQVAKHPEANRYAIPRSALPPVVPAKIAAATDPAPAVVQAPVQTAATARPQAPQPVRKAPTDIFEQALARANSHIEKPTERRHTKHRRGLLGGRALTISAASLSLLLIVGFFAWQQKAALTMKYVASKAGVAATLPSYKPTGFSAGNFIYSPGSVAVNFSNNQNGDSFSLIQKSTSWDSQALLDSFVGSKSRTYQTIEAAGRTIYTYGNSATWVDKGVWYQVNSKGSLNTNQLVQLALSL